MMDWLVANLTLAGGIAALGATAAALSMAHARRFDAAAAGRPSEERSGERPVGTRLPLDQVVEIIEDDGGFELLARLAPRRVVPEPAGGQRASG